jgi:hypothetical protein
MGKWALMRRCAVLGMAERAARGMMAIMAKSASEPFGPHTAVIQRNARGQFLTGHKQVSPGRPKGSRNKLAEDFLADLHETWQQYGLQALRECAQNEPARFVQICASLLPKDIDIKHDISVSRAMDAVTAYRVLRDMSDEERKKLREADTVD